MNYKTEFAIKIAIYIAVVILAFTAVIAFKVNRYEVCRHEGLSHNYCFWR